MISAITTTSGMKRSLPTLGLRRHLPDLLRGVPERRRRPSPSPRPDRAGLLALRRRSPRRLRPSSPGRRRWWLLLPMFLNKNMKLSIRLEEQSEPAKFWADQALLSIRSKIRPFCKEYSDIRSFKVFGQKGGEKFDR